MESIIREQFIDNVQPVDEVVTALVVGQPMPRTLPGTRLLRPVRVNSFNYQYRKYSSLEQLNPHDAERAMRAPIKHSDRSFTMVSGRLKRYSWMEGADDDELQNADSLLRLRELKAASARTIVEMAMERAIHSVVTNVTPGTTYAAGNITALTTPFNHATAGDSRTNIRASCAAIAAATGMPYSAMTVFLPESSLQAAYDDPTFLDKRKYTGVATPGLNDLASYWGVGSVWTANALSASGTTVSPLYGDIAIVYLDSLPADYDTEYGELVWGASFKWNRGTALQAFRDPKHTTTWFPWQDYLEAQIINTSCAAIITNCAT